jgi:hypothetical protein
VALFGQRFAALGLRADQLSLIQVIETGGSNEEHDGAKLESLLEHLLESEIISDGILAQDSTQLAALWALRESIPEAAGKCGSVYKYDLSVPVPKMYSLVEKMRERLTEKGLYKEGDEDGHKVRTIVGCESSRLIGLPGDRARSTHLVLMLYCPPIDGHMGDSNLHINICAKKWDSEVEEAIEPLIYELTCASSRINSSSNLWNADDPLSSPPFCSRREGLDLGRARPRRHEGPARPLLEVARRYRHDAGHEEAAGPQEHPQPVQVHPSVEFIIAIRDCGGRGWPPTPKLSSIPSGPVGAGARAPTRPSLPSR